MTENMFKFEKAVHVHASLLDSQKSQKPVLETVLTKGQNSTFLCFFLVGDSQLY